MFQTEVVDKIKTHFMFNKFFFSKILPFMRKFGRILYSQKGHRWDSNTAHEHCMLDTKGYKHTLRICNTYCFSHYTTVAQTRLKCYVMRTLPVLFITEKQRVYCAVRTESSYAKLHNLCFCTVIPALSLVLSHIPSVVENLRTPSSKYEERRPTRCNN